jgi:hypothetical protein
MVRKRVRGVRESGFLNRTMVIEEYQLGARNRLVACLEGLRERSLIGV